MFLEAEYELHTRRLVVIGGGKHGMGAGMGHGIAPLRKMYQL